MSDIISNLQTVLAEQIVLTETLEYSGYTTGLILHNDISASELAVDIYTESPPFFYSTTTIDGNTLNADNVYIANEYDTATEFENNTITVDSGLSVYFYVSTEAPEGPAIFAGNDFVGDGASSLSLDIGPNATIDTMAGTISVNGEQSSLTGFTSFSNVDVKMSSGEIEFIVGPGNYSIDEGASGSVVYTPKSGNVLIEGAYPSSILMVFQGFGPGLNEQTLQSDITTDAAGDEFIAIPGAAGTIEVDRSPEPLAGAYISVSYEFEAACYCRGTRILTTRGEIEIERLVIGDAVITAAGGARPVTWIGHRALDLTRHGDPESVWPIRVSKDAFAPGAPHRDLWLSPGHNVAIGGALIPISALRNDKTVARVQQDSVEYWHVELDAHDIILAEGLPAESYLDCGNRAAFANGGAFIEQQPDFRPRHWAETCLPLVHQGPQLEHARSLLLGQAAALGYQTTLDADLHIIADGRRFEPFRIKGGRVAFALDAGRREIALVSRTFLPSLIELGAQDMRTLGVCVGRLQIDGEEIDLADEAALSAGWHGIESTPEGRAFRWTAGRGALPPGGRLIVVESVGFGRYWSEEEDARRELAGG